MEPFGAFFGTKCTPYLEARSGVKGLTEFAFQAVISEFKFRANPGLPQPSFEQPGPYMFMFMCDAALTCVVYFHVHCRVHLRVLLTDVTLSGLEAKSSLLHQKSSSKFWNWLNNMEQVCMPQLMHKLLQIQWR